MIKFLGNLNRRLHSQEIANNMNTKDNSNTCQLLAIASPLPPEKSGISFYTARILPALSKYYNIVLIHPNGNSIYQSYNINAIQIPIYPPKWLDSIEAQNAKIIYQIGNSHYHSWILSLLLRHPGIVVLHDYYLSHLMNYWCLDPNATYSLAELIYYCNGYKGLETYIFDIAKYQDNYLWDYSLNQKVLQSARGVIIHNQHIKNLAGTDYKTSSLKNWFQVPLISNQTEINKDTYKGQLLLDQKYNLTNTSKVICSFGYVGPSKLSLELLEAFIESELVAEGWLLFFAGAEGGDEAYNNKLRRIINKNNLNNTVHITGWLQNEEYASFLDKADICVQLRTKTRGETSGALIDCLQRGSAVIINNHGSLAEIPKDVCSKLAEYFTITNLSEALIFLANNSNLRAALGVSASKYCNLHHSLDKCAEAYYKSIESIYRNSEHNLDRAKELFAQPSFNKLSKHDQINLINNIAIEYPANPAQKRLYVDVSAVAETDLKSGIQRVTNKICKQFLKKSGAKWIVEPVKYNQKNNNYVTATCYSASLLGIPNNLIPKESPVLPNSGDIFLVLDLNHSLIEAKKDWLNYIQARGAEVWFIVYDLLPCQYPEYFPHNTDKIHEQWLMAVSKATGAICISETVANDLRDWILKNIVNDQADLLKIKWFHLGSDFKKHSNFISNSRNRLSSSVGIIMVGTIEPRKGYLEVLKAMQILWERNIPIQLTIVGQQGWKSLPDNSRRDIPETIKLIRFLEDTYPNRLRWLDAATDEQLSKSYESADILLAASYGEGFGLPLIEAKSHGLSVIARDIPIFREVLSNHALFFSASNELELADWLLNWYQIRKKDIIENSVDVKFDQALSINMTWAESCDQLIKALEIN